MPIQQNNVNLALTQRKFKVFEEESYLAEKEPGKGTDRYWHYELRGSRGKIWPYSENKFAALIKPGAISQSILRSGKWEMVQDTTEGRVFLIDSQELSSFAEHINARKKRWLTDKQRKSIGDRLRRHHFKSDSA